jgi:hypothetical protein
MVLTRSIHTDITASTAGTKLSARSEVRVRNDDVLIFDSAVHVRRADDTWHPCGSAAITLHLM